MFFISEAVKKELMKKASDENALVEILDEVLKKANGRTIAFPQFYGNQFLAVRVLIKSRIKNLKVFDPADEFYALRAQSAAEASDRRMRISLGHDVDSGNARVTGKTARTGSCPASTRLRKAVCAEEERARRANLRGASNGGGQQKQKGR